MHRKKAQKRKLSINEVNAPCFHCSGALARRARHPPNPEPQNPLGPENATFQEPGLWMHGPQHCRRGARAEHPGEETAQKSCFFGGGSEGRTSRASGPSEATRATTLRCSNFRCKLVVWFVQKQWRGLLHQFELYLIQGVWSLGNYQDFPYFAFVTPDQEHLGIAIGPATQV